MIKSLAKALFFNLFIFVFPAIVSAKVSIVSAKVSARFDYGTHAIEANLDLAQSIKKQPGGRRQSGVKKQPAPKKQPATKKQPVTKKQPAKKPQIKEVPKSKRQIKPSAVKGKAKPKQLKFRNLK